MNASVMGRNSDVPRGISKGERAFVTLWRALGPSSVMAVTWSAAVLAYVVAMNSNNNFQYFDFMVRNQRLVDRAHLGTYIALFGLFCCFFAGTYIARATNRRPIMRTSDTSVSINVRPLLIAFTLTCFVAVAWVGGAIVQMGGVGNLAALAASDNLAARDALRSASFPGGRLISYGFIGTCALASAYTVRVERGSQKTVLAIIVIVGLAYLAIMPILVSGRITFFVACIGSYVAATLSAHRILGLRYLAGGLLLLAVVWGAKQYFTLGNIREAQDLSVLEQGVEGIIFYFYNDMLNALNAIELTQGNYMYGWFSMRSVFFMTFSDTWILDMLVDARLSNGEWLTAGEVPLLSAPYVDFGPLGIALLLVMGFVAKRVHVLAFVKVRYAAIYGLIASGLVLSAHSSFLTGQEVVYSVLLIVVVASRCESSVGRSRDRSSMMMRRVSTST